MSHAPLRVLIVEDDPDSARMLRVLLKRSGYETRVEHDGAAVLAAAREFRPGVVLLDQTLEGMSGSEVAAQLRAAPELDGCAILAVSGHASADLPDPAAFDEHFPKPIDHDSLLAYLARASG